MERFTLGKIASHIEADMVRATLPSIIDGGLSRHIRSYLWFVNRLPRWNH